MKNMVVNILTKGLLVDKHEGKNMVKGAIQVSAHF
jgi:hypothetical protein